VASILSNTLLLDTVAADAAMLRRLDRLGQQVDAADREGLAPTGVFVLRPSVPLTDVARATRPDVGQTLGAVLRYLHAEGDALPDLLSLLLYDPAYLRRLLLLGYADARNQHDRLAAFFEGAGLDASPGA
jgi:NTE family protein